MKQKPLLTAIIILNWNRLSYTKTCIDSLLHIENAFYKIIVIDNGSVRDDCSTLHKKYNGTIEVYRLPRNIGFTGGCNFGISRAKKYNPDFYLLLNNDTEVDPQFLSILTQTACLQKRIGIVGPLIYDYYDKKKLIFSGGSINWLLGKPYHDTTLFRTNKTVDFVTGCCLLVKKEVVQHIGVLDDRFFAYFEDVSYCLTARSAGYVCVCVPNAKVFHRETGSSSNKAVLNTYLIARNRILFVNNYLPWFYKGYFFFFNIGKLLVVLFYFTLTQQKERAYAFFYGYTDGMRNRGGIPRL